MKKKSKAAHDLCKCFWGNTARQSCFMHDHSTAIANDNSDIYLINKNISSQHLVPFILEKSKYVRKLELYDTNARLLQPHVMYSEVRLALQKYLQSLQCLLTYYKPRSTGS